MGNDFNFAPATDEEIRSVFRTMRSSLKAMADSAGIHEDAFVAMAHQPGSDFIAVRYKERAISIVYAIQWTACPGRTLVTFASTEEMLNHRRALVTYPRILLRDLAIKHSPNKLYTANDVNDVAVKPWLKRNGFRLNGETVNTNIVIYEWSNPWD